MKIHCCSYIEMRISSWTPPIAAFMLVAKTDYEVLERWNRKKQRQVSVGYCRFNHTQGDTAPTAVSSVLRVSLHHLWNAAQSSQLWSVAKSLHKHVAA